VKGTLTSGQMNTSLVGVLLVTGILYKVVKTYNLRLENCGDDCSLFGERQVMKGIRQTLVDRFSEFGMVITMSDINLEIERVEFCQTRCIFDGYKYRAVRCIEAALSKDAVCIDYTQTPHRIASWSRSVALGGLASFGGIPVIQSYYKCLIDSYNNFLETSQLSRRQQKRMRKFSKRRINDYSNWEPANNSYEYGPINHVTRLSFEVAFGITPVNQELLEQYYENKLIDFKVPSIRDPVPNALSLLMRDE
jgi:hypothetical protein